MKIYDKQNYNYGEVMDAQTLDNGETWALVRWNSSPWYPDWIQVTDRYILKA